MPTRCTPAAELGSEVAEMAALLGAPGRHGRRVEEQHHRPVRQQRAQPARHAVLVGQFEIGHLVTCLQDSHDNPTVRRDERLSQCLCRTSPATTPGSAPNCSRRVLRRRPRPHRRRRQAVAIAPSARPPRSRFTASRRRVDVHRRRRRPAPLGHPERLGRRRLRLRARERHRAGRPGRGERRSSSTADLLYTNTGEGLHRFIDPLDGETYLYSQFETADAKRMYACFDQPDLKATFTIHATVPEHWEVVVQRRG